MDGSVKVAEMEENTLAISLVYSIPSKLELLWLSIAFKILLPFSDNSTGIYKTLNVS